MSHLCGLCVATESTSEVMHEPLQLPVHREASGNGHTSDGYSSSPNGSSWPAHRGEAGSSVVMQETVRPAAGPVCGVCCTVDNEGASRELGARDAEQRLGLAESLRLILESPELKPSPRAHLPVFFEESIAGSQTGARSLPTHVSHSHPSRGLPPAALDLQQQVQQVSTDEPEAEVSYAARMQGGTNNGQGHDGKDTTGSYKHNGSTANGKCDDPSALLHQYTLNHGGFGGLGQQMLEIENLKKQVKTLQFNAGTNPNPPPIPQQLYHVQQQQHHTHDVYCPCTNPVCRCCNRRVVPCTCAGYHTHQSAGGVNNTSCSGGVNAQQHTVVTTGPAVVSCENCNGITVKSLPSPHEHIVVPLTSPASDREASSNSSLQCKPSCGPTCKKSKMNLIIAVTAAAVLIAAAIVLGVVLPYSFTGSTGPIVPVDVDGAVIGESVTFYAPGGYLLSGADPVAYFKLEKDAKPVTGKKGDETLESDYKGLFKVAFENKENKQMFDANPEAYLPKYGAWCAFAMAFGEYVLTDPAKWEIHEGKLYLTVAAKELEEWRADRSGFIKNANTFWQKQGWTNGH
ncbi:unnamed protein product [Vitrella brassicaformis CCMP3155]|uniref:YHS domain-containing protein n=2 Tax=Vitrella brassicaformis TaxID=1169539 RepID=A0A0G4ED19_VITBC|nr:unnamed protein product [Vitrella brassicaformis CCMP3155]|mmetsp:Transcript_54024/g.135823  ORF Transcript_54024/g.135823 Transcript_54024/m.135823 type:complete len:571 (+) Transcript_54024:134-1846(+)|eukprot:CEL93455.1 unnamed protein product [Vitrella brassicaformis CCMP3155]